MQNLFKKINDGVKAVFESDSYGSGGDEMG